ncbi:MAG TPA: hypothetical protein VFE07_11550 [Marmoricola sp.]|jgi:hypothetical protein|nr:hypothetical protein [Marmoricola sp.]
MKLIRAAVLVTVALAVTLTPTSAFAQRYTHHDITGDVLSGPADSDANPSTPDDRANGDVVWSTVIHKRHRVVMKMQLRDIAWNDETNLYGFIIKTKSMKRIVTVFASEGIRGGKTLMTKPSGKRVACHISRKIDYTANNVTVSVPRSCLGTPRWVKVGMATVFLNGFASGDTEWVDDANSSTLGSNPVLGPKVRR